MKKILIALFLGLSVLVLSACTVITVPQYDVYVTVYPLEYIVDSLAVGTDLTCGMVPGVTSHEDSVDWSPKQIIAMTEANYLFYVGANFDVYIDNQIESIFQNKDVTLVKLETAMPDLLIQGIIDTHETGSGTDTLGLDPHFWTSPKRMLDVAGFIYEKMIDPDTGYPEYAEVFAANLVSLLAELGTLDLSYNYVIGTYSQKIMTSTNLYGYLKTDYGLDYCSISPGYHEETDQFTAEQKDLVVAEATLYGIRYIIYERNASSPLSNAIFDALVELGVDPVKLEYDIMHFLSEDDRTLGLDYYDIMQNKNLELLKTATGYIG
jgi:zinc transport system substrate-binding protein